MRVVLFTSAEPLYLPRYLQPIFEAHADTIDQVVIAPFDTSTVEELRSQAGMYGASAGIRMALRYGRSRVLDALPGQVARRVTGRYHSVSAVARAYGVTVERIPDVSDPTFVERMEALEPDLLLSIVAGQRLPRPVLESADDAVNLHGSLLPKYRGRATAFWPLFYGDARTGVTAHRMTERFDAGPILAQQAFPLDDADTVDSVYRKLAETGASLAVELLDAYPELPAERPNETTPEDYHGLPGPEERRLFYERGNAFL
ncbi:Formyl transferase [Halorientalis persicus]|uniref:Formyl transferase n=1 Tax=Halorientalis persicus TaxID=1367881 RepID=A0A1H8S7E5_9EURY|nr:formyltransferase family protein [Halorientalis persicus]SEO74522.1 Formyl transferase [Halorientalis persicus]